MTAASTCPRCAGPLRAPGLMSSSWECELHGPVHPMHTLRRPTPEALRRVAASAAVPLWCPLPLLPGWTVSGLGFAGDEREPARATVLALTGPSPLGGPADLVLLAEEPGIGAGSWFAGREDVDPGAAVAGAPAAKIEAAGHPTPLWSCVSADDRVAFVGEAKGVWLWAVLWPPAAELVLLEHVELHDLRHEAHDALELPFGALSPRLPGVPAAT